MRQPRAWCIAKQFSRIRSSSSSSSSTNTYHTIFSLLAHISKPQTYTIQAATSRDTPPSPSVRVCACEKEGLRVPPSYQWVVRQVGPEEHQ